MVGSCNGLVCFIVFHHGTFDPVYICNPVTREHVHLPRIDRGGLTRPLMCVASGFGYHSSTNEYKVIRIYYVSNRAPPVVGRVEVYTIGSGSGWRNKEPINHFLRRPGIFTSGAIHWLESIERSKCNIIAFDLADEEFRLLPLPPCNFSPLYTFAQIKLVLLGGNLCASHYERGKHVDIWELKKIKNSGYDCHSWSKKFSIACEGHIIPVALTRNNQILLWYNDIFSCYDLKTTTLKKLWDDKTGWLDIQAVPHMNSLVSLKALGEVYEKEDDHISERK